MNGIFAYQDPEIDRQSLKDANHRHDSQHHAVSMWTRANYRGGFNYPPDPKKKRKRVWKSIDAFGNIVSELK